MDSIEPRLESLPKLSNFEKEDRIKYKEAYARKNQFYAVEYSPKSTKPAKCKGCNKSISVGTVRFRHLVCGMKCCKHGAKIKDTCGRWHPDCLLKCAKSQSERFTYTNKDWTGISTAEHLAGFSKLSTADQETIFSMIINN